MSDERSHTTIGACTVCARRDPPGYGLIVLGAVVLGVGIVLGLGSWYLAFHPAASAASFVVGGMLGMPLLVGGLVRSLRRPPPFATGLLAVPTTPIEAGRAFTLTFEARPDHPLFVRSATCELLALEKARGEETRIVLRLERPLDVGVRIEAPLERTAEILVPKDWPPTMTTPSAPGLQHRELITRVRVAVDFDAHPLLAVERDVVIARAR